MASLYVHIPFCEKKCLYCDFYSIENSSLMHEFLDALNRDLAHYAGAYNHESFETIFFGGGTPSLLTPKQLESIFAQIHAFYSIDGDAEITLETNPGTVTPEKLAEYRALGINRLSIGIQSFHEDELKFLTRIHTGADAVTCVESARNAGFDNISVDLIYALPGQSKERWGENLKMTLALSPEHISAYGLIVEENTPLARLVHSKLVNPKPADEEAEFFVKTMEFLEASGFEHYEVSNYARPGFRSKHNYNYWRHVNYLGFGPSAHSFWRDGRKARRWSKIANLSSYVSGFRDGSVPLALNEQVTEEQLLTERIFLGLRSNGINLPQLRREFPVDAVHWDHIPALIHDGLAAVRGDVFHLTRKGFLICDEIAARLLS